MSHDEMDKLINYLLKYAENERRAIVEYILVSAKNIEAIRKVQVPTTFLQDTRKGE
ncbi:hypothetical protein ACW5WN_01235 [Aeromonas lacus]|uniref:hypothetical protein n=1 Tax=Aeromonas lacus TaxID=558884 RepID=UPI001377FCD3|nr:hypothetical protein [Aeromonas lacus]